MLLIIPQPVDERIATCAYATAPIATRITEMAPIIAMANLGLSFIP